MPTLVLLGWCGLDAVDYAIAGTAAAHATRELERASRGRSGGIEARLGTDLRSAADAVPHDPSVNELIALAEPGAEAERRLTAAIEARPGSGYTWANLVAAKYRAGETGQAFEKAVVNAARLAPFEPEVQRTLADFGLAAFDEMGAAAQASVERALKAGMKRNAPEILQIAARRGRLGVACRHLDGVPRPAVSKWTQLCQSMEATS